MQFLLSVHANFEAFGEFGPYASQSEMEQAFADTGEFNQMLQERGHWVFAGGLQPASAAVVVDGQGDEPTLTPGPAESGDRSISGMWIIEAPSQDVAEQLAAAGSKACRGAVEVRPFHGE